VIIFQISQQPKANKRIKNFYLSRTIF